MAHILLINGANPNIICTQGERALHVAVSQENYKITKLLLQFGAKVNCKNCFGATPLQKAAELRNTKIIRLLFSFGAKCDKNEESYSLLSNLILTANSRRHLRVFKLLLSKGANINSYNSISRTTILHLAAMRGVDRLTSLVVENGANIYNTDKANLLPLNTALYFKNVKTASIIYNKMDEIQQVSSKISPHITSSRTSTHDSDFQDNASERIFQLFHDDK